MTQDAVPASSAETIAPVALSPPPELQSDSGIVSEHKSDRPYPSPPCSLVQTAHPTFQGQRFDEECNTDNQDQVRALHDENQLLRQQLEIMCGSLEMPPR